jgi:exonuclease SbcC
LLSLTNDAKNTEHTLTSAAASVAAFEAYDASNAELESCKSSVPTDPSEKIFTYESYLRNFDSIDEYNTQLPVKAADLGSLSQLLEECSTGDVDKRFDAASGDLKSICESLLLRKNLQKELAGVASSPCCEVCGSSTPDHKFLSNSIVDLENRRLSATTLVDELATERLLIHTRNKKLQSEFDALDAAINSTKVAVGRMVVSMMAVGSRETVSSRLAQYKIEKNEFILADSNLTRSKNDFNSKLTAVSKLNRVTSEDFMAAQLAASTASLALSMEVADPDMDTKESVIVRDIAAMIRKKEDSSSAMASLIAAKKMVDSAYSLLEESLGKLPTTHPELMRRLSKSGSTVTVVSMTESAEEMRAEQSAYDNQLGKLTAASEALREARNHTKSINDRIAEQGSRRLLALELVRLRDTFKPSGASLDYIDYRFGQIAAMASDYLSESHADFMVAASATIPLSFEFIRLDNPDETWLPQNRMSGGQKVRLAVATLRAIHALVMPGVGLLVLDEPTTHLDDDAKTAMAEMLKKIGDEGTLQMIVCDHSPVLIDAFSDVIEIAS